MLERPTRPVWQKSCDQRRSSHWWQDLCEERLSAMTILIPILLAAALAAALTRGRDWIDRDWARTLSELDARQGGTSWRS